MTTATTTPPTPHDPITPVFGRRRPYRLPDVGDYAAGVAEAERLWAAGDFLRGTDVFEQVLLAHPRKCVPLLARLYDLYQTMPGRENRYDLYQRRHYDFGIRPGDRVLDVGSGNVPLPLATHQAEFAIDNDRFGRAGQPMRRLDGVRLVQASVQRLPFADKSFDFVYCSHIMEHVVDPVAACAELSRVARRGYIESPTRAKDLWMDQARCSNHNWFLSLKPDGRTLVFDQYTEEELTGLACDVLMKMHCDPRSDREKAFSALIYLRPQQINTCLLWEGGVRCEVRLAAGR
ncbi:MAG TPA: class I SAM-dependent methyltransferase [Tepidisphaeraceae bacterium]|nr:class I SAM-dependent methyltransferase [Tepidisphaeraceae bacterium]